LPIAVKPIGKPAPWLIRAAAGIGLEYSHLSHETTDEFERHVMKRHGDPATNGSAAIRAADFAKIPGIIQAPDLAIIGAKRSRYTCNAYAKYEGCATYIYFEDVLDSNRHQVLRGHTFYRLNRPVNIANFIRIVTMNEKTDISEARITVGEGASSQPAGEMRPASKVLAAGGQPGGEI
jgi:hypothetical protein